MTSSIPLAKASQIQRGDYTSNGMDMGRTEELGPFKTNLPYELN